MTRLTAMLVCLMLCACASQGNFVLRDVDQHFLSNPNYKAFAEEYRGPLRDLPEVKTFIERLPQILANAIARQQHLLGVEDDLAQHIHVIVRDRPDDEDADMETRGVRVADKHHALIVIYANALISWRSDPSVTLEHEVNHALLRVHLGEHHEPLPTWFVEGLALLCTSVECQPAWSCQGEMRVQELYQYLLWQTQNEEDTLRVAHDLLEANDRSYLAYARYYLYMRYFASLHPTAIRTLIQQLHAGTSFTQAIRDISGVSLNTFLEQAKHAADQYLSDRYPQDKNIDLATRAQLIKEALKPTIKKKAALLMHFEQQLNKQAADRNENSFTNYLLALHSVARGHYADAVERFADWFGEPPVGGPLAANALQAIAIAHASLGENQQAIETCLRIIHGYGYDAERVAWANQQITQLK